MNQCTLSAKDRGATKNPAVDLEVILMHHFSRIFRLDASSVLSRSTEYSTQLFSSWPYFTQNMIDQKCYKASFMRLDLCPQSA